MTAMSYLQLAQRLREKCRISGNGPTSVAGQSGEMLRVVNWINEAWQDIQAAKDNWLWMQGDVSFSTVAQQAIYTAAQCGVTDLGRWDETASWRVYDTAVGTSSEQWLDRWDYDNWRDVHQFGSLRSSYQRPTVWSVTPEKSIALGHAPDSAGYTITGKYFRAPSDLSGNADTPDMPERFHMMIVYRAMMFYASSEVAPEIYQEGMQEFSRWMRRLERDQLPHVRLAGALY